MSDKSDTTYVDHLHESWNASDGGREEIEKKMATWFQENAMPKADATIESLLREWRDAREEWFSIQYDEIVKMDRTVVLSRLGKAEHALMDYARML